MYRFIVQLLNDLPADIDFIVPMGTVVRVLNECAATYITYHTITKEDTLPCYDTVGYIPVRQNDKWVARRVDSSYFATCDESTVIVSEYTIGDLFLDTVGLYRYDTKCIDGVYIERSDILCKKLITLLCEYML